MGEVVPGGMWVGVEAGGMGGGGGGVGGRKAEACLWDQERQEAGESPHQPWAAAFEEPENIYRDLLEISNERVICYSSQ